MALTFDATLKGLAKSNPDAFLATFDAPPAGPVAVLSPDLSTVTMGADLVLGIGNPLREVVHLDLQSGANRAKHFDVLTYNALLHREYEVPIHSILVFLRPQAAHSNQTGTVLYQPRPGRGKMEFGYEIVRLWERPAEALLVGELGALPLAPLGKLSEGVPVETALAHVVQRLVERLLGEAPAESARTLLTAAFVLTGLRIGRHIVRRLFQGVQGMRDSDTYMAILDEGRLEEAKKLILQLGQEQFGAPDESVTAALNGLEDLERLERMGVRLLRAASWREVLATP